jgi:hypothetical protein
MDRVDNEAVRATAGGTKALANAGRARQAGWLRALEQALLEMKPGNGDARDAADARQPGQALRSGRADAPGLAQTEFASPVSTEGMAPATRRLPAGTAETGLVPGHLAAGGLAGRAADPAFGRGPQVRVEHTERAVARAADGMLLAPRMPAPAAVVPPGVISSGAVEPARPMAVLPQPPTSAVLLPLQMPVRPPAPVVGAQGPEPATEARTAPRENAGPATPQHLFLERTADGLVAWIRDAAATSAQVAGLVQALRAQAAQLGLRLHSVRLNGELLDETANLAEPGDPAGPGRDPSTPNLSPRRSEPHGD